MKFNNTYTDSWQQFDSGVHWFFISITFLDLQSDAYKFQPFLEWKWCLFLSIIMLNNFGGRVGDVYFQIVVKKMEKPFLGVFGILVSSHP